MPDIRYATDQPNAAIGPDQRSQVAECIRFACDDPNGPQFDEAKRPLQELAVRLGSPGPPLVSTADIVAIFELISLIAQLFEDGHLDHPWGQVKKVFSRYSFIGQTDLKRMADHPHEVAHDMYMQHLKSRGLVG